MASFEEKLSKIWDIYITNSGIPGRLEFLCTDGVLFGPIHILKQTCPYIEALLRRNNSTIIEVRHPKKIVRKVLNYLLYLDFKTPDFTIEETYQSYELARYWCIEKFMMRDLPLRLEIEICIGHLRQAHSYMFDDVVRELSLMIAQHYRSSTENDATLVNLNKLIEGCSMELRSVILTGIINKNAKPSAFRNVIPDSEIFTTLLPCFTKQRNADSSEFTFECKDGSVICPKFFIYEICPKMLGKDNFTIDEEMEYVTTAIIAELTGKRASLGTWKEIYQLMNIVRALSFEYTLSYFIQYRFKSWDLISYLINIKYCVKYGFEADIPRFMDLILVRLEDKYISQTDKARAQEILNKIPQNVLAQLLLKLMMKV